jgi:PAS domain S-box-containing protein
MERTDTTGNGAELLRSPGIAALLDALGQPVLIVDDAGLVCVANRKAHGLFGYAPGELLGVASESLVAEDLRRSVTDLRTRISSKDGTIPAGTWMQRRYVRQDGSEFAAEMNFTALTLENTSFIVSSFHDLAESSAVVVEMQNFIEAAPDAMVGVDERGIIRFVNRQTELMFGYSRMELIGQSLELLVPQRFRQTHAEHRDGYFREPRTRPMGAGMELFGLKRDGTEFSVDISLSAFSTTDGVVATASIRDISDEVSARKRAALEARAEQVQRLEALGQLAGGVAHDFNNMLAIILNYAGFIESETDDPVAVRNDAKEIIEAAQRAAGLTRQLLMFGRRDVVHATVLDLNAFIEECTTLLHSAVGESVDVIVKTVPGVGLVRADRTHVEQVLLNLAINARDAMTDGGQLVIETKPHTVGHDDEYSQLEAGDYVCLSISDTGCGMTKETMSHAFEPFYTTKPKDKGTGLGLATVYGVVSRAGGTVAAYSEPDVGTTFRVYFPVSEESPAPPPSEPASPPAAVDKTVMVVEDDAQVKEMTIRILEKNGYRVVTTESSRHALEMLQGGMEVDLLLTDVFMPEISGAELAAEALDMQPSLRVILVSGHPYDLLEKAGIKEPLDLMQKPFGSAELLQKVAAALDDHRP